MLPATRCPNNLRGHPLPCPRLGSEGKCSVNTTTPGPWREQPPDASGTRAGSARLRARFCPRFPRLCRTDEHHEPLPTDRRPASVDREPVPVRQLRGAGPGQEDTGMGPPRPPSATLHTVESRREASVQRLTRLRVPARRGRSRGSTAP